MSLTPGTRLGIYEVTAKIGEGGMGEVYQARDTTLDRDVALKVLPEAFTTDPDRLARFQREAKVLASLNHPNIGAIYGLEAAGDTQALVLELIEGPTLADRIAEGPIPVDEALTIATQIAEALEAAHEQGIIHRDLKPANVKVRSDGTVKVLDFGLAKAVTPEASGMSATESPTMSLTAATQMGMVIGTAAYMAPEQAKGKSVDKRADIWAFGAVLFEVLTGQRLFRGETGSETLAAVMMQEPAWEKLPDDFPRNLGSLLRRCLEKDPRRRIRDIGDVRLVMRGAFEMEAGGPPEPSSVMTRHIWQQPLPLAFAMLVVGIIGGLSTSIFRPSPGTAAEIMRFTIDAPEFVPVTAQQPDLAISPDGARVIYTGDMGLYIRTVNELEGSLLRGTDGAAGAFISPDGEWVGFVSASGGNPLQKVSVSGGPPVTIASLPSPVRGGTWSRDDEIIVGTSGGGLFQVSAGGGEPEALTVVDTDNGEVGHYWPSILPDGRAVVFVVATGTPVAANGQLAVLDLDTREVKRLDLAGLNPRYVTTGHLIYAVQDGSLFGVRFDLVGRLIEGTPVPLLEGVSVKAVGAANFTISDAGRLVYQSGAVRGLSRSLVWVDRQGAEEPISLNVQSGQYVYPRLSPDGKFLAVVISENVDDLGSEADIWMLDLERGSRYRVTFGGNNRFFPVWGPDGEQVAFADGITVQNTLRVTRADGAGRIELLLDRPGIQFPTTWTSDGGALGFYENHPESFRDIWVLPLEGEPVPQPLVVTPFQDRAPTFSPDGRWFAYVSDKSGRDEVYARPYPSTGPQEYAISVEGGTEPVWSRDGRELFYRHEDRVMVVSIEAAEVLRASAPELLFSGGYDLDNSAGGIGGVPNYDVSLDGERFVVLKSDRSIEESGSGPQVTVVLNWFEELEQRIPTP